MSDRWERVSALFTAARALEPRARDAFLALACEGEEGLRSEVEKLLEADTPDDGFLEDPPWTELADSVVQSLNGAQRLASGQVLNGRYLVEKSLASGGQALVYLAHDQHLDMRPVVIKVMRSAGRRSRWLKARFQKEMQALARIDHPGVVGILDVGELEDGSPYLVIQHIPGMSLRELLVHGPVPPARAAEILRQMGSALSAAHGAGIAHRDLKPENIMLQPRNDGGDLVRLIDFGIAKVDRSGLEPDTTAILVAGTVRYMAPEQFEGSHSPASDVYTMALVACEMLGGYPHIRALPASTRRETIAALEAALAFRPEERPTDVRAWSERVARSLVPGRSRARWIIAAVALVVLLIAGAALERRFLLDSTAPAVVEKVGGFDPLTEGFQAHEDVARSSVSDNPTHTGYDAWRVVTTRRGIYVHPFLGSQERRALRDGWKLSAEMRTEEGAAFASAEFSQAAGRHFAITVLPEGDQEIVRLVTELVPEPRGPEVVQKPRGAYHRYELFYDPARKAADLWIDGERRIPGYRGTEQNPFRLSDGLVFGAAQYRSQGAAASFRSVRFEITN